MRIYKTMDLKINEIFYSIQGETTRAGFPCIFIRLTGCNLQCKYCDTTKARSQGEVVSIENIVKKVVSYNYFDHITITGGEPLVQPDSIYLMKKLLNHKYNVQLETNGSLSLADVPKKVKKIVDVKTPSSSENLSFLMKNLTYINKTDEIKFVISNIEDYNYSVDFLKNNLANSDAIINFSPAYEMFPKAKLSELIIVDRLPVRVNLQLHKIIWPQGEPKGKKE